MSTGEPDPFEGRSKAVFRDHLLAKYPALGNSSDLISSIESVKLTYDHRHLVWVVVFKLFFRIPLAMAKAIRSISVNWSPSRTIV